MVGWCVLLCIQWKESLTNVAAITRANWKHDRTIRGWKLKWRLEASNRFLVCRTTHHHHTSYSQVFLLVHLFYVCIWLCPGRPALQFNAGSQEKWLIRWSRTTLKSPFYRHRTVFDNKTYNWEISECCGNLRLYCPNDHIPTHKHVPTHTWRTWLLEISGRLDTQQRDDGDE